MRPMRPISTILAFHLVSIASGFLFAEGCVSIAYRNQPHAIPIPTALATGYCWIFVVLSIAWAAYALHAERRFQSKATRETIPLGLGVAGAVFLFFFFIGSGLAVFMQPVHLHD